MKRSTALATVILAGTGIAPVAAQADHKPGHEQGGGQPPASALSLTAQPNPSLSGRVVTLSGKLASQNKSGQSVTLRSDPFPFDVFGNVGTATTNAAGDFTFAQRPTVNTRYQARSGSDESAPVTVLVRPRVGLRLSDYTPRKRQPVRFFGRVCPEHDGSVVAIQRRFSGGFRSLGRARLRDLPGSRCSTYSRAFRLNRDGRFRVVIGGHADHARGISRSRVANVS